jgi:primosomal protein N' (replication factor Y)
MIAEIIINSIAKDLNKTFDYIVPKKLEKSISIGTKVLVPFGQKTDRIIEGYVVGIKEVSKYATKEILNVEECILTEKNVEMANLMARRYFCNVSECIRLMLPPGKKSQRTIKNSFQNKDIKKDENHILTKEQQVVYNKIVETSINDSKYKEFLIFGVTGSRKD